MHPTSSPSRARSSKPAPTASPRSTRCSGCGSTPRSGVRSSARAPPAATAAPTAKPLDITVTPAGEQRGDHGLVLQIADQPGSIVNIHRIWDVPLDGSPPTLLVSYTQVRSMLTGFDYFSFERQLS